MKVYSGDILQPGIIPSHTGRVSPERGKQLNKGTPKDALI